MNNPSQGLWPHAPVLSTTPTWIYGSRLDGPLQPAAISLPRDDARTVCAAICATLHRVGPNETVSIEFEGTPIEVSFVSRTCLRDLLAQIDAAVPSSGTPCIRLRTLRGQLALDIAASALGFVDAFASHVAIVHADLSANVDVLVTDSQILTASERETIDSFNDTAKERKGDLTLWRLLERAASLHANRQALVFDDITLTYAELHGLGARVAHALRSRGVGPGSTVGVCLLRSPALLAALLGVLRVGAAYLPLDADQPVERTAFMVSDAGASCVIAESATSLPLPIPVLEMEAVLQVSPVWESTASNPEAPAYLIYTSGSTGRPKAVLAPHRAVVNYLLAMAETGWMTDGDTMLAHSAHTFDASIPELFLPLLTGGRIALVTREVAADGMRLRRVMESCGVTAMFATPATYRLLLDAGWKGSTEMKAHCGGEMIPRSLLDRLLPRVKELYNVYGPTETTVYATLHRCRADDIGCPVGRPIANCRAWVVDDQGRPVAPGVPGELLIGGHGVALGYHARPELTEAQFIADPSGAGRAYRSGDLARLRRDGNVEILGRFDDQIKLRGYRIEPGEIESALAHHAAVGNAIVGVHADDAGQQRLVAWISPRDGAPLPAFDALRAHLRERLPEYMVPVAFVPVEQMPLNRNGKVDRRALPPPGDESESASGRPINDLIEFQLARLVEEVLDRSGVSANDDFFGLGGSSMAAVRLIRRIETVLGRRVPLISVFKHPTPAQLATWLRTDGWTPTLPTLVKIGNADHGEPFFCVHALIGEVCRDLGRGIGARRPFYGLQPRGLDGSHPPLDRVEDLASHYIEEIQRMRPRGPYHLGGYCFGGVVAYEMARQLELAGETVGALVIIDSMPPNLADGASLWQRVARATRRVFRAGLHLATSEKRVAPLHFLRLRYCLWRTRARAANGGPAPAIEDVREFVERQVGMDEWPPAYQAVAMHNYLAWMRYIPKPYGGTLTLVRNTQGAVHEPIIDWGWGRRAAQVDVRLVEGDHRSIIEGAALDATVQMVEDAIGAAETCLVAEPSLNAETSLGGYRHA